MVQHQLYATMPKYVLRMAGEGASPSWYANVNPAVVQEFYFIPKNNNRSNYKIPNLYTVFTTKFIFLKNTVYKLITILFIRKCQFKIQTGPARN